MRTPTCASTGCDLAIRVLLFLLSDHRGGRGRDLFPENRLFLDTGCAPGRRVAPPDETNATGSFDHILPDHDLFDRLPQRHRCRLCQRRSPARAYARRPGSVTGSLVVIARAGNLRAPATRPRDFADERHDRAAAVDDIVIMAALPPVSQSSSMLFTTCDRVSQAICLLENWVSPPTSHTSRPWRSESAAGENVMAAASGWPGSGARDSTKSMRFLLVADRPQFVFQPGCPAAEKQGPDVSSIWRTALHGSTPGHRHRGRVPSLPHPIHGQPPCLHRHAGSRSGGRIVTLQPGVASLPTIRPIS